MSTRCTTHFIDGDENEPCAIVYRHSDGYPEGAGKDIYRFFDELATIPDPRFTDPHYLAAKYVVFLADMFNFGHERENGQWVEKRKASKFDFLSVGILAQDNWDVAFRYVIDCSTIVNGRPKVTCYSVDFDDAGNLSRKQEVPIELNDQLRASIALECGKQVSAVQRRI